MKALISIFLILVAVYIFTWILGFYDRTARNPGASNYADTGPATPSAGGEHLPGLPPFLESSLAQARQGGVEELAQWLKAWRKQVQDPRLAWIELDYVVLLNVRDHKAARERFLEIKARTPPNSPVYERIEKLTPAYEP